MSSRVCRARGSCSPWPVAKPHEILLQSLARQELEAEGGQRAGTMPAPLARSGRDTGMDEQAQFIHEVSPEQCSDERSAAVNADRLGTLVLAQRGECRREINAFPSRHELPDSPLAGVPRGGIGTEREDIRPVSALAQRLPFTDAPAAVDDSEQRPVGGRTRARRGCQGLLLSEDGVGTD